LFSNSHDHMLPTITSCITVTVHSESSLDTF
jgi:hypothetical protein